MLIFLLIIIAVGVLLCSEDGRKILAVIILLALCAVVLAIIAIVGVGVFLVVQSLVS